MTAQIPAEIQTTVTGMIRAWNQGGVPGAQNVLKLSDSPAEVIDALRDQEPIIADTVCGKIGTEYAEWFRENSIAFARRYYGAK